MPYTQRKKFERRLLEGMIQKNVKKPKFLEDNKESSESETEDIPSSSEDSEQNEEMETA